MSPLDHPRAAALNTAKMHFAKAVKSGAFARPTMDQVDDAVARSALGMIQKTRCSLLFVEDDDDIRRLLPEILKDDPFKVTAVNDTLPARVLLEDHKFDCTLLDLNLITTFGLTTIIEMRALYPKQPIVVMTGNTELTCEVLSAAGADSVLYKGMLTRGEIITSIAEAMGKRK